MAHATPVSGSPGTPAAGTRRPPDEPDVFSERTHIAARWSWPALLGLVYGYWAAALNRDAGPITGWNVLFGFASAFAFTVLYIGIRAAGPRLKREPHALAWAAFAGIAFGFLYNLSGGTVLRSSGMALAGAATVFAIAFYWYYTHEDAAGHRVR
jgi:hypothetical protein